MADEHASHHVNYLMIFIMLCVCTLLSIISDVVPIDRTKPLNNLFLIVLVLAIATAKALFVLVYFMHLKFEGKWKFILLAPTVILAIGLPLALYPDIGVHYYTIAVPQAEETPSAAGHHASENPRAPLHHTTED
jgi:cytochrome c oxidase subunit 4